MPRPKEFDPDEALERAMELFWERGYEATSVEELVQRMGINRFSLYSTFGSKRELFLRALDRYNEGPVGALLGRLESDDRGLDGIRAYFRSLVDATPEEGGTGCLVVNTATERSGPDADVDGKVHRHFERMEAAFRRCLETARERGEVASSCDVDDLARFLVGVGAGLAVLARTPMARPRLEAQIRVALAAVESDRVGAPPR